jgi:signal transduction histidine kinase
MGGEVHVVSKPGEGSTFLFTLPVAESVHLEETASLLQPG